MLPPIDTKLPHTSPALDTAQVPISRHQTPSNSATHENSWLDATSLQQMYASSQHIMEEWLAHARTASDSSTLHPKTQKYSDALMANYGTNPLDLIRHLEWPDQNCSNAKLALLRSCALWLHLTERLHYPPAMQQEGLSVLLLTPTAFVNSPELTVMDSQQLVKARQRWRFASYASALQWRRGHEAQQEANQTPHQIKSAASKLPSTWRALYDMSYQSRQQSLHQIHPLSALLQWCWAFAISMTPQWRQSNGQLLVNPPRQGLKQRLDKLWFETIPASDGQLIQQIQRMWECQPPPLSFGILINDDDHRHYGQQNDEPYLNDGDVTGRTLSNAGDHHAQATSQQHNNTSQQQPFAILSTEAPWLLTAPENASSPQILKARPSSSSELRFRWLAAEPAFQPIIVAHLSTQKSQKRSISSVWSLANLLSICRQSSIKKQVEALQSVPSMVEYICLHATTLLKAEPPIQDVRHAIVSIGQEQLPAILIEAWLDQQLYQQRKPALELLLPWFKCFAFILQQLQVSSHSSPAIQTLDRSQCRQLSLLVLQQVLQHTYWNERPALQALLLVQKMIRHPELWPHIQQQTAVLHFPKAWQQTLLDMANGRSSAIEHSCATEQSADAAWHVLNLALDILQGLWQGQLQEAALAYQQFRSRFAGFELRWSDFLQEILLHSDICCRIGTDL